MTDTNKDILIQIQKDLAVLTERYKFTNEKIDKISDEMNELKDDINEMKNMANRWKGGFLVLAGLGGLVGWIFSTWGSAINIFGGK